MNGENIKAQKAPFNVKYQKNLFFKMAGVNPKKMGQVQIQEMTRSFYAGFGNCLILLKNEMAELSEEQGIVKLSAMLNECESFWIDEVQKGYSDFEEI